MNKYIKIINEDYLYSVRLMDTNDDAWINLRSFDNVRYMTHRIIFMIGSKTWFLKGPKDVQNGPSMNRRTVVNFPHRPHRFFLKVVKSGSMEGIGRP